MIGAVIAGTCAACQRSLQISSYCLVGVGFRSHQRRDALGRETVLQPWPHAGRDQHLHLVQRMRFMR